MAWNLRYFTTNWMPGSLTGHCFCGQRFTGGIGLSCGFQSFGGIIFAYWCYCQKARMTVKTCVLRLILRSNWTFDAGVHIDEVKYVVERWRIVYNHYRPHSSLSYTHWVSFCLAGPTLNSGGWSSYKINYCAFLFEIGVYMTPAAFARLCREIGCIRGHKPIPDEERTGNTLVNNWASKLGQLIMQRLLST